MKDFFSPRRFSGRVAALCCLTVPPFLHFLLYNDYGLFRSEVLAVLLLLIVPFIGAAALARRPAVFYVLAAGVAVLMSTNRVALLMDPDGTVHYRWVLLGLGLSIGLAMRLLREKFVSILVAFALGATTVDFIEVAVRRFSAASLESPAPYAGDPLPHVLYLILDEHLGLAALPEDIPECRKAERELAAMLADFNFRTYPRAFSNYAGTRNSVPSALNLALLENKSGTLPRNGFVFFVREPKVFGQWAEAGYGLSVYESDYLRLIDSRFAAANRLTYKVNSLSPLQAVPLTWLTRISTILGSYLESDAFLFRLYHLLAPRIWRLESQRVGPLALRSFWPGKVLEDIRAADRKTLFFAHLLTPHHPYVYRSDGRFRDRREWDRSPLRESFDSATYRRRYTRYAEQVRFLTRQLRDFFGDLRAAGLWESMTVIVHGDHGSRLRLVESSERSSIRRLRGAPSGQKAPCEYDYPGEPPLRDLLDRFSTLLAIKEPLAERSAVVAEPGGLLRFLCERFSCDGDLARPGGPADSVYLFDCQGVAWEVRLAEMWKDAQ